MTIHDLYAEGERAYRAGRWVDAARIYEELARGGDTNAQVFAGCLYLHGSSVPRDLVKSRYWLERAAQQGDKNAELYLAHLSEVEGNAAEAVQWLRRSAAKGSGAAHYWLGRKIVRGELSAVTSDQGRSHLREGMRLGHVFARKEYGLDLLRSAALTDKAYGAVLVATAIFEGSFRAFANPHDPRVQL
jgi:TPR repeat protein